jgi:hypothetical protein
MAANRQKSMAAAKWRENRRQLEMKSGEESSSSANGAIQ